jgi:hypothetical protein
VLFFLESGALKFLDCKLGKGVYNQYQCILTVEFKRETIP